MFVTKFLAVEFEVTLYNSAEIGKITAYYLWADVMLRQPRIWASKAPPAQK